MNANEIVRALRNAPVYSAGLSGGTIEDEAATLIESLQAQLADLLARNKRLSEDYSAYGGSALERADDLIESMEKEITVIKAQLTASQRRERAAVEDMKLIVDAVREAHSDETCCFACKFDCDTSITDSGAYACECPGFERDDCFEWRDVAGEGENDE